MIFGVIGVGSMGKNHIRVLSEIKKVEGVVVYDPNSKRASEIAKIYDAEVADSLESLLKMCDAVSICSPTQLHVQHVEMCISEGKNTLVEKPLAPSYDDGKKVLEILRKNKDIVFGVGHIERFNPVVSEIASLGLDATYIDVKRHNPASMRIQDATVVEDLMIHDIDTIFNVLYPEAESFRLRAAGNKNVVQAIVVFGNSVVSLSASRISSKKIRSIYIENEEMTVEGDFMTQELYIYRKPSVYQSLNEKYVQENVIEKVLINKVEPLKVELRKFVDAVEGKDEFPVTAEQAVKNLKICEMIKRELNVL